MNSVTLLGRLVKDVELRYTSEGKGVTNFTIAVRNPFKGDGGADFIQCVAWDKTAEVLAEYTQKGSRIAIKGTVNTRTYENKEGIDVYITEVGINQLDIIDFKEKQQEKEKPQSKPYSKNSTYQKKK